MDDLLGDLSDLTQRERFLIDRQIVELLSPIQL